MVSSSLLTFGPNDAKRGEMGSQREIAQEDAGKLGFLK